MSCVRLSFDIDVFARIMRTLYIICSLKKEESIGEPVRSSPWSLSAADKAKATGF